jgi:hypothetical protein
VCISHVSGWSWIPGQQRGTRAPSWCKVTPSDMRVVLLHSRPHVSDKALTCFQPCSARDHWTQRSPAYPLFTNAGYRSWHDSNVSNPFFGFQSPAAGYEDFLSSGLWRSAARWKLIDVSEEHITHMFRVEDLAAFFILVSCLLAYSSTLTTDSKCSSGTSIVVQRISPHYIPEDRIRKILCLCFLNLRNIVFIWLCSREPGHRLQIPWPWSTSELYRQSYRLLSAKLVPTFANKGCCVADCEIVFFFFFIFLSR